jgi:hypothetical protein
LRLSGSDLDFNRIYDIYDRLGPIPRLCFDKQNEPEGLQTHQDEIFRALREVSPTRLQELVTGAAEFSMSMLSSKICLIKRVHRDKPSSHVYITPITDFIGNQLVVHLRLLERREQIRLYNHFSFLLNSRGMTGKVFEAYCQVCFQSKIHIELIPMVRLPDPVAKPTALPRKREISDGSAGVRRTPRPQWHSSHTILPNKELEKRRQEALGTKSYLNIRPLYTIEYMENDLAHKKIMPDVYYIPRKGNQVALDSFIVHQGFLDIFQFTNGQSHDIKDTLIPFLAKCTGLPTRENWRFIFIIPDDVALLKCPVPHSVGLQNLPLFSSIVALEQEKPSLIEFVRSFLPRWLQS